MLICSFATTYPFDSFRNSSNIYTLNQRHFHSFFFFFVNFYFPRSTDFASSVQVSFEKPDSGFFFKHSSVQPQQQLINNNPISDLRNNPSASAKDNNSKDSVLSFNRFTVAQANHPVSIRASYGPFSTKQTVPARYIVPEDAGNYSYQKVWPIFN